MRDVALSAQQQRKIIWKQHKTFKWKKNNNRLWARTTSENEYRGLVINETNAKFIYINIRSTHTALNDYQIWLDKALYSFVSWHADRKKKLLPQKTWVINDTKKYAEKKKKDEKKKNKTFSKRRKSRLAKQRPNK